MPLFEYVCAECEARFEELRSPAAADDGVECPGCGSPEVARQFSTFATGGGGGGTSRSAGSSCVPRGGFT